jgi:hypothetical protein
MFPTPVEHTPESVANIASHWIKTCEAHHSECFKQASPPTHAKMPTRLLDLGDSNSTTWCIYQTPTHVPYAALSHRWSHDTPTLLKSNYQDYYNPQSDSALPQNYRDIVSICRAIPIRYLWIDSLCIIQDDDGSEFRREASFMMEIYQYAFLTLTICWDFPGLTVFRKCRPRSVPRYKIPASYGQRDSVSQTDEYVFVEHIAIGELRRDVDYAPLNQRAWVLQERCLSRRLLYLGGEQLYWECDGCTASDVSPGGIKKDGARQSILDLAGERRDGYWSSTINKYTASDLTFEKDRLIAIAGLAKLVASKTRDTYLAGIWLESWMQDLLWEPARGPNSKRRSEDDATIKTKSTMVRPSWSWLGYPGSVISGFSCCGRGPKISITDPNSFESDDLWPSAMLSQTVVTPPGSDPFTSFERAVLKIRCLLLPVRFAGIPHREEQPWFFRHEYDIELSSTGLNCMRLRACEPFGKHATFRFCFSKPVDFSSENFLLPLYDRRRPSGSQAYGLVVQETLNNGKREFIRTGTWREDSRYASQLRPMISNTIVIQGVEKDSTLSKEALTANERMFDSKLRDYGVEHSASKVRFPFRIVNRAVKHPSDNEGLDEKGSVTSYRETEQKRIEKGGQEGSFIRDELVECWLLPHFTKAEWSTIFLV